MKTNFFTIMLVILSFTGLYSQNSTLTLGQNGVYYINDYLHINLFNVNSVNGQVHILNSLRIEPTTNSSIGVIFKGADRFIHNYQTSGTVGNNTFVGINSGNFTMGAGTNVNFGSMNTAVGYSTLKSLTTGRDNTAVGSNAISQGNISYSSAFGSNALKNIVGGSTNSAFGYSALSASTSGVFNSAFGAVSLANNFAGVNNSAFGTHSLAWGTTGSDNSAFGFSALSNNNGDKNSAFGVSAGNSVSTGSNLTLIGYNAQPSFSSASNEITFGDNNVGTIRANVSTITSLSDERDKKNIQELNLGIDFLMKVQPRLFNWDKREWYENNESDGSKMLSQPTAGFIAQEFDELQTRENAEWLNLVLKTNPEKFEATAGNLLPIMVKAIQDLKKENDELKATNQSFQVVNDKLQSDTKELKEELSNVKVLQNILLTAIEKMKLNNTEVAQVVMEKK